MKLFLPATLLISSTLLTTNSIADVPAEQQHEVEHIISFVSDTDCELKRNFSYHSGKEAAAHIQKKYNHFKDEVNTTEDFIRLSASKSLLTGKTYQVKCANSDLTKSNDWLTTELKTYREQQTAIQTDTTDQANLTEQALIPKLTQTPNILITELD